MNIERALLPTVAVLVTIAVLAVATPYLFNANLPLRQGLGNILRTETNTTSSSVSTSQAASHTTTSSSGLSTSSSSNSSIADNGPTALRTLTVNAETTNGKKLADAKVEVISKSGNANESMLPARFVLREGQNYVVTASNVDGFIFSGWGQGQTSRTLNITAQDNQTLTAIYQTAGLQTISVSGKTMDGKSVAGVSVDLYRDGVKVNSDVIPTNFTVKYGGEYTVAADGHVTLGFKYWNGNESSTSNRYNLTADKNVSLTAYYEEHPLPEVRSGPGNHTITVIAHNMDGGPLVGMYFQVRIHGAWNKTVDGFTPASVSAPDGSERIVMYHCARINGTCSATKKFFVYRYYDDANHTLTRWKDVNLTSIVLNSYYEIIPAEDAVNVHIESDDATTMKPIFTCTCGALITIYHDGRPIAQSLSPYSFFLRKGETYKVTLGQIPGYTFAGWSKGNISQDGTFVATPQNATAIDQDLVSMFRKG